MVTYNSPANTWHCPCAKPRISCVQKNISKWHLFQTKPDVFRTKIASTSPSQQHQDSVYPPSAEDVKQLVQYIYRHKKLPANLPIDLVKPSLTNYITELHPTETICTICPGSVYLEKSTIISRNARITINGVIERKFKCLTSYHESLLFLNVTVFIIKNQCYCHISSLHQV